MIRLVDVVPAERINPHCRHPDRYHLPRPQTGTTEVEVSNLIAHLFAAARPNTILETGTHSGDTTRAIATANPAAQVVTLELDAARAARAAQLLGDLPNVRVICADTLTWRPPEGTAFDCAYFDASRDRIEELRRFLPCLRSGAIIAIHDSRNHHPTAASIAGITEAVGFHVDTPRGVWIGRVP